MVFTTNQAGQPLEIEIVLRGGPADAGEVPLDEYRASLEGWQSLIELSARLYFLGERADPARRTAKPLELTVRAPNRGSVETRIILALSDPVNWGVALTLGVAANTLYDVLKASMKRFPKWLFKMTRSHVEARKRTSNVDSLANELRKLLEAEDLPARQLPVPTPEVAEVSPMFPIQEPGDTAPDEPAPPSADDRQSSWLRQIVENIDLSLEQAARPITVGCTSVAVRHDVPNRRPEEFTISPDDYTALLAPLSHTKEDSDWIRASIKFRRIDRETGTVMFRFLDRPESGGGNQFGYIADKSYKRPHNPYTRALDGDVSISVWLHAEETERGGARYAITTARPPKQLSLLD